MATPPAAALISSPSAQANGQLSSDIREMLLSSLATNNKVLTKELPELQRRAAKYHASLQKAHEDGLALSQALGSVAEANTNSELNKCWTFFSDNVKHHEGLRQDLLKVIADTFVAPMGKVSDADEWARLEKEIRRESDRFDAEALKATSNMNKLGKGGSSEVLAKAVNDLNAKVKEHEVKRSEMMTDADDFSFKRQGFIIASNQHVPSVSASLIQVEKLEFHPSHQHLPFQWRPTGSSGDLSNPSSPKAARSSVMVQLSSLGHSISSKIRPTSKKPEEKKKRVADDKAKERTNTSSTPLAASSTDLSPPMMQPLSYVRAVFDYQAGDEDELSFKPGDVIAVIAMDDKDWWEGELNGQIGFFPSNYVEMTVSPRKPKTANPTAAPQAPSPAEPGVSSPRSMPAPVDAPLQATVPLSVVSPRHEAPLMPSNSVPGGIVKPKSGSQIGQSASTRPAGSPAPAVLTTSNPHVPKQPAGEPRRGSRIGKDSSGGSGIGASPAQQQLAPSNAPLAAVISAPTKPGSQNGITHAAASPAHPTYALAGSSSSPSPAPAVQRPQGNVPTSASAAPSAAAPSPALAPAPAPASVLAPVSKPAPAAAVPAPSSPAALRAVDSLAPPSSTAATSLPSPHFAAPPPPPPAGENPEKIGAVSAFKITRPVTGSAIRPAPEAPPPAVGKVQLNKAAAVRGSAAGSAAKRPSNEANDLVMQKLAVELQETEDVILALLPKQQANGTATAAVILSNAVPINNTKTVVASDAAPVLVVPAPGASVQQFHPEDWEACTDDNGDTFYFNIMTSESVWEIPGFTAL